MTRVLLLIPVIFVLSFIESRIAKQNVQSTQKSQIMIPWFAIGFGVVIGINSLHFLPDALVTWINHFDNFLLTMAMAAIGIETNFLKIKKVGLKPLYLAIALFLWLTGSVFLLTKLL